MKISDQLDKAREFLHSSIVDGWYPYSITRGKTPSIEATAWALIAMVQTDPQLAEKQSHFYWPTKMTMVVGQPVRE